MKEIYILDTDMGYDPDDLFALIYMLNRGVVPEFIISGDECEIDKRARIIESVLRALSHSFVPVYAGEDIGSDDFVLDHLLDSSHSRQGESYLEAFGKVLASKGNSDLIYICIQGATNLAKILEAYPEAADQMIVYMMGGALNYTRENRPDWIEHNLNIDPDAFDYVLASTVNTHLVMAQTTHNDIIQVEYHGDWMELVRKTNPDLAALIDSHFAPWVELSKPKGFESSNMHDPLTVATALGESFVGFNRSYLRVEDRRVVELAGPSIHHWSRKNFNANGFMKHLFDTILY